jgi:hypothetical protein
MKIWVQCSPIKLDLFFVVKIIFSTKMTLLRCNKKYNTVMSPNIVLFFDALMFKLRYLMIKLPDSGYLIFMLHLFGIRSNSKKCLFWEKIMVLSQNLRLFYFYVQKIHFCFIYVITLSLVVFCLNGLKARVIFGKYANYIWKHITKDFTGPNS